MPQRGAFILSATHNCPRTSATASSLAGWVDRSPACAASTIGLLGVTGLIDRHVHRWPGGWPVAVQVLLTLLLSSYVGYWTLRWFHRVGWLRPFHAVHHAMDIGKVGGSGLEEEPVARECRRALCARRRRRRDRAWGWAVPARRSGPEARVLDPGPRRVASHAAAVARRAGQWHWHRSSRTRTRGAPWQGGLSIVRRREPFARGGVDAVRDVARFVCVYGDGVTIRGAGRWRR